MRHEEIEELLGVYALDATGADERAQIEAHLAECPQCRSEVAAHQEMAALLGGAGTEAPPGLWEKIAGSIAEGTAPRSERPAPELPANVVGLGGRRARPLARRRQAAWSAVVAVAAAIVALLGLEVAQLHSEVRSLNGQLAVNGLRGAEVAANAGPHQTVSLALADRRPAATVIITPSGGSYWEWSSLHNLPSSETYQLWGLVRGKPVSLGLVGNKPDRTIDYFVLQPDATELMVTAEPEGGTPGPTTAVLAQGAVPRSALT